MENLAPQSGEDFVDWIKRLLAYAQKIRLIAGDNTRIERSGMGAMITYLPARSLFMSPFLPTLVQGGVTLAQGLIDDVEPRIRTGGKSVPISGDTSNAIPPPILKLDPKLADAATQTSFIAVEIEADKDGKLTLDKDGNLATGLRLEVVHVSKISDRTETNPSGTSGGKVGVKPLAMVVWNGNNAAEIFTIRRHNQEYARTFPKDGQGAVRHFLWAV